MTFIFAHRGSSGTHPENTMLSFKEAARVGADGIETDVQLTKDNHVVLIHDEKLDRITGVQGFVKDRTLKELQALNVLSLKGGLSRQGIPTLEELLIWLCGNQLYCMIELKNALFSYPGLEQKVIRLIRAYAMEDRFILSSFNHYSLVYCHRLAPEIETAPLYRGNLYMPWVYARAIGASAIHPNFRTVPKQIIRASIEAGVLVRPYTINHKTDMEQLYDLGCSAIITDFPKNAYEVREACRIKEQ